MIIINRKRIHIILCCLLVSLFTFAVQTANNNEKNSESSIETTATPASGKTIVIDAGHGTPDEGDCLLTLNNNN